MSNQKLVFALPNGRILKEVMPLLRRAGIQIPILVMTGFLAHEWSALNGLSLTPAVHSLEDLGMLDRMAREGMKLTSFYAAPVCSVSWSRRTSTSCTRILESITIPGPSLVPTRVLRCGRRFFSSS